MRFIALAKVTGSNVTPQHVKAARALLDWNASDLAKICSVGVTTLRKFEAGMHIRDNSRQAIYDALVKAGR